VETQKAILIIIIMKIKKRENTTKRLVAIVV